MVHHLRTAVSDDNGAHVVIIAPVLNTKTKLNNKANTQQQTQTASGQHLHWVPNATTGGLGALLHGLSCTYCVFDIYILTDVVASIAPKGTYLKANRRAKQKGRGEVNKYTKGGRRK